MAAAVDVALHVRIVLWLEVSAHVQGCEVRMLVFVGMSRWGCEEWGAVTVRMSNGREC